jgi:peptidoglycan-associated lipoprotein
MKSINLVTTLAIAAALMMGVTGCKKAPKNVTGIPRMGVTPIQDDRSNPKFGAGQTGGVVDPGTRLPSDPNPTGANTGTSTLPPFDPNKDATLTSRPQGTDNREALKAETVYFEYDKATVKSSEVPKVQRVATYLKNQPSASLRVEGNCDERGTEEYNRSLGERRALAVRELLAASGIAPDRITTLTNGEDQPADTGHDETAWGKNRRAEFVVITPDAGAIR